MRAASSLLAQVSALRDVYARDVDNNPAIAEFKAKLEDASKMAAEMERWACLLFTWYVHEGCEL